MDEWWRSEFISCHLFWILFFSNFLHSIYFFAQSQSLLLSLGLSFSLLSSFSLIFSPGFSSWPSQASSWCHFNIWQGVGLGGNRKCGLKSELKWLFHRRLLMFWWQNEESSLKFVLNIISANEEKLMRCKVSFLTSKPHFLDLRWFQWSQSSVPAHLDQEVKENTNDVLHLFSRTCAVAATVLEDGNQIYHLVGSRVCAHHPATNPDNF